MTPAVPSFETSKQKYIIQKTKHNTTETKLGSPPQLAHVINILIVCSPRPHQTQHLIHEDLHLHQPGISVPRRSVGYHSSKGNQSSGLTSELRVTVFDDSLGPGC